LHLEDGKVDVMAPVLICIFNDDTNMPISILIFRRVECHGDWIACPEQWRTQKGLDIFGPRHLASILTRTHRKETSEPLSFNKKEKIVIRLLLARYKTTG
jgi:DUF917 family protein